MIKIHLAMQEVRVQLLVRELGVHVFCSVAQSCLPLCDPMDCSPPGSSVHGVLQARILERVAISSSRRPSRPRVQTRVSCTSCIGGGFFTPNATSEALRLGYLHPMIVFTLASFLLDISHTAAKEILRSVSDHVNSQLKVLQ